MKRSEATYPLIPQGSNTGAFHNLSASYDQGMNNESTTEVATAAGSADVTEQADSEVGIIDELLIEEISIDGMCGVY